MFELYLMICDNMDFFSILVFDNCNKNIVLDGQNVNLNLWDTTGILDNRIRLLR